jgi:hypothetical protein
VGLEEYEKVGLMDGATTAYMASEEIKSDAQACAMNLKQKLIDWAEWKFTTLNNQTANQLLF